MKRTTLKPVPKASLARNKPAPRHVAVEDSIPLPDPYTVTGAIQGLDLLADRLLNKTGELRHTLSPILTDGIVGKSSNETNPEPLVSAVTRDLDKLRSKLEDLFSQLDEIRISTNL